MWNTSSKSPLKHHEEQQRHLSDSWGKNILGGATRILFDTYYRLRLISSDKATSKPLSRKDLRSRLVRVLVFLSDIPHVPISPPDSKASLMERRLQRQIKSKEKWAVYHSARPLSASNHAELTRWGMLGVYPDVSFSSFFDLGGHVSAFPQEIREEYYRDKEQGASSAIMEGQEGESFFKILQKVCELQLEWAAKLFLMPSPSSAQADIYQDLIHFSGQLLSGLVLLSELIDLSDPDSIFHIDYYAQFKERFSKYFEDPCGNGATFADLLFLHGAVCRFWSLQTEMAERDGLLLPFETENKYKALLKLLDDRPVCKAVLMALYRNPVSNLLLGSLFSDMDLARTFNDSPPPRSDRLIKGLLSNETLFWVADYASSLLLAPYGTIWCDSNEMPPSAQHLSKGHKESTYDDGPPQRPDSKSDLKSVLFRQRIANLVSLIFFIQDEAGESSPTDLPITFLQSFYELLLREWLEERDQKIFPSHPLPPLNRPPIPISVTFSHFSKDESHSDLNMEILTLLRKGDGFEDVAAKYSDENLARISKGYRGRVDRKTPLPENEMAIFLFPADGEPFYTKVGGKFNYFLIHKRENPLRESLLERIILWAHADRALRIAVSALFAPLHSLISNPEIHNMLSLNNLRGLYRKAQFLLKLAAAAERPFHGIHEDPSNVDGTE